MNVLLLIWAVVNGFVLLVIGISCAEGVNFSFVNPIVIYNNIKVNWFGAFVLAVIFNILLPIIAIPYWIYKLFTVGR